MKINLLCIMAALFAAGTFAFAEPHTTNTPPEKAGATSQPEAKSESESRVKRGPHGETILALDAATQKTIGLQTAALEPARLPPELKAYGRVLDISPLAALTADLTAAQATSDASQAELKRLKTLAAQNNASERALQGAEATAVRDQTQVESVRLRLLANWGSVIAQRQDLPALVRSLGSLASALVQLNVSAGQAVTAVPTGARLFTLADPTTPTRAEFLGPAPVVDPQMQARGFLLLVPTNSLRLAPGFAVTGFLLLPGEAQDGVALPRQAVVRFNGATWVYLQTGDDTFARVEVKLDRPLENSWFVFEGLKPQDKVVTVGAQQLLSEELKGQAAE